MSVIKITHGDTFLADCIYKDASNNPANLTTAGITIEATALSPDGTDEIDIEVTIKNQTTTPGGFQLKSDTAAWGFGVHRVRISYISTVGRFTCDPILVEITP
jgi:hypothetical protein